MQLGDQVGRPREWGVVVINPVVPTPDDVVPKVFQHRLESVWVLENDFHSLCGPGMRAVVVRSGAIVPPGGSAGTNDDGEQQAFGSPGEGGPIVVAGNWGDRIDASELPAVLAENPSRQWQTLGGDARGIYLTNNIFEYWQGVVTGGTGEVTHSSGFFESTFEAPEPTPPPNCPPRVTVAEVGWTPHGS